MTLSVSCAQVQTGCNQIDLDLQQASAQYTRTVYDRLPAESGHHRDVFPRRKRVNDLKPKLFAAVDAKAQVREQSYELTVRLSGEETIRLLVHNARD